MDSESAPPLPRQISVTQPVAMAFERVKQMLFRPFDLAKWITIGFCAWLAGLGQSGTGASFNFNNSSGRHHGIQAQGQTLEQMRHVLGVARNYFFENFMWIVPLGILLAVFGVAVWLLVLWLSSRGKFMFLHCVALEVAEVAEPWKKFAAQANSLFWFRVCFELVAGLLFVPALVLCVLAILRMAVWHQVDAAGIVSLSLLGIWLTVLMILLAVAKKFLEDFVIPIMYLRGTGCLAAWRDLGGLLAAQVGQFVIYLLFQIVLTLAIFVLVLLAVLATCCLVGCLLALPFLGTVALLPVLIFKRAYPLYYLAQHGLQYDVFLPRVAPPPVVNP